MVDQFREDRAVEIKRQMLAAVITKKALKHIKGIDFSDPAYEGTILMGNGIMIDVEKCITTSGGGSCLKPGLRASYAVVRDRGVKLAEVLIPDGEKSRDGNTRGIFVLFNPTNAGSYMEVVRDSPTNFELRFVGMPSKPLR